MFSLREYLITKSEQEGSTISYDEKKVHDTIQRVHAATLTWAKGLKLREVLVLMKLA